MTRRAILLVFMGLLGSVASGCAATEAVIDAAEEHVVTEYLASYAQDAWLSDNGELAVCFYGWPTGRPVSGPAQPYTMTVPSGGLKSLAVAAGTKYGARAVLAWRAPPEDVETGCIDRPETASPVTVQRFSNLVRNNEGQILRKPLYELLAPVDLSHPGPVVYTIDDGGGEGIGVIVYQHGTSLPGGARFVRLDPPYESKIEYNALILVLPAAIAVDATMGLLYIVGCIYQLQGVC